MLCAVESSKPTRSVDSEWLFGPKTGGALAAKPRSLDQRLPLAKGGVPTCVVAPSFRADSISWANWSGSGLAVEPRRTHPRVGSDGNPGGPRAVSSHDEPSLASLTVKRPLGLSI